jgi:hypothetical protein
MALQNRVDPAGAIRTDPARGLFMGNRGGPLHDNDRRIVRPHKSQSWIICLTSFKNRRRPLMQPGRYTELFFTDEATALSAGHRPCFECRRKDALAFAGAMARGRSVDSFKASEIDDLLHRERRLPIEHPSRGVAPEQVAFLPNGVFLTDGVRYLLVLNGRLLHWSYAGYTAISQDDLTAISGFQRLTPASTATAIRHGYRPILHPSADIALGTDS